MLILFVTFLVIQGAASFILYSSTNKAITTVINDTRQSFYMSNEKAVLSKGLIVKIERHNPAIPEQVMYTSYANDNDFTDQQINHIVVSALRRDFPSGNVDNVYYEIAHTTGNENFELIIVATDAEILINDLQKSVRNTSFALVVIFIALGLVIWSVSQNIIMPVKTAFDKQRQFISDASHELKTPLTVISANADILKNNDQASVWVENIKTQTARMEALVSDMLMLAKIDEREIAVSNENFSLSEEILGASLPFEALAFEKGKSLDFDIQENISYKGDKQSLRKIVSILIDNAIKHSNEKGAIKLTLKKDTRITLSVFNTGCDIPDKDGEKVFERFYRGDNSRSRDSGGSGLGLAIAKTIVDANKWKITATPKINVSMTITITF